MNGKMEQLDRYLLSREDRLEAGEVLTVKLVDGMLTAYKEEDPETKKKKIVTLIETFDDQLDIAVGDLLQNQL
ncbi:MULTISPECIES: hypothetical protein [Planococcus]|uniref:hypothetical protein n=1 Tax=Planococcus TaxID=1372 RepID=UPI00115DAED9|nr:hypothetical protein [Planococcus soli]